MPGPGILCWIIHCAPPLDSGVRVGTDVIAGNCASVATGVGVTAPESSRLRLLNSAAASSALMIPLSTKSNISPFVRVGIGERRRVAV